MTADHHQHDPRLRLRLFIAGRLYDEVWIDSGDPGAQDLAGQVSAVHVMLAELADAAGVPWLTEVFDPGLPEGEAYIRIGTDAAGMVAPIQLNGIAP